MTGRFVPTLTDLLLAYRQAKIALYFERRGVGLLELAEFESDLTSNLRRLQARLSENGGWFDNIPLGVTHVTPKRSHPDSHDEKVIRIGCAQSSESRRPIEVQLRLQPSPQFAIVEILYLHRFGPALDRLLCRNAVGYRLDLRGGGLSKTRRWVFEYWPDRYQQFRTSPLATARAELGRNGSVAILSADLASFYDSIDPAFLLCPSFLKQLNSAERGAGQRFDIRGYRTATQSLLDAYSRYRASARRAVGLPWQIGVPIGALTSRVVANLALAPLDDAILSQKHVLGYQRYVDDLVIVARTSTDSQPSFDEALAAFLPHLSRAGNPRSFDNSALNRAGSTFQLSTEKIRLHFLTGVQGSDFLDAVADDFASLVSDRRAFLDTSVLLEDVARKLVRAGPDDGTTLRVLRDADRSKLENFELSNVMRSLERASLLLNVDEAKNLARSTLDRLGRFLDGDAHWLENLELQLRLLRLATDVGDFQQANRLSDRMDTCWGTVPALRLSAPQLLHRGRTIVRRSAWASMHAYLHARRLEMVCSALRPMEGGVAPAAKVRHRSRILGHKALSSRAQALAVADLRARDREDDKFPDTENLSAPPLERLTFGNRQLRNRIATIQVFSALCSSLGDKAWAISPLCLFLCTRPPSYFDVARRLLYRVESTGFDSDVFDRLLSAVNAIRGTSYRDPVGTVVESGDSSTVAIPASAASDEPLEARIILGNLVCADSYFIGMTKQIPGSATGAPVLSRQRLIDLTRILDRARECARIRGSGGSKVESLLVLPELALPRDWFRTVAKHVVEFGEFGLVTGLEYHHDPAQPFVLNQAYAVLPGPLASVATWPWTKTLPARVEERELAKVGLRLRHRSGPRPTSVVVCSPYGRLSVLICSELLESRKLARLLGRVELLAVPAWNPDTASYDHLIQAVGLQLNAVIAIANNGHYSDCRAWAPRQIRWQRDLCRLIERDVNDVVFVDLPLHSLRRHRNGDIVVQQPSQKQKAVPEWQPLPPDWP